MPGLIGKKVGMTSIFEDGKYVACTIIETGPCYVTQLKTKEKDRYEAVQIAFDDKKEKNTTKPMQGHFSKAGLASPKRVVQEFDFNPAEYKLGQMIDASLFSVGDIVKVAGTSKGKGFQGVVKRHGFAGVGGQTHGQHNRGRHPGSVGACSFPARTFKGTRMAGRTGGDRVKISGLKILRVDPSKNMVVVSGPVPGANGSYVTIYK